jgi:predicted enzyme related to lactoylglutathione lyase
MKFRFSRNIAIQTPRFQEAVDYFQKVIGLELLKREDGTAEFKAEDVLLYVDQGEELGPVYELIVSDAEQARDRLIEEGCEVEAWEGPGGRCYLRDPFGFVFNVWEDQEALVHGQPPVPVSSREDPQFWGKHGGKSPPAFRQR